MKDGLIVEEGSVDRIMQKYRSQSPEVFVRLAIPCTNTAKAMSMLPSANASNYNEASGVVVLGSAVPDLLYTELISFIAQNNIKISELIAQKTTLEDVYFAITGLGGRA
jgi:ABC-type multidrug transport system ATPase subunit